MQSFTQTDLSIERIYVNLDAIRKALVQHVNIMENSGADAYSPNRRKEVQDLKSTVSGLEEILDWMKA